MKTPEHSRNQKEIILILDSLKQEVVEALQDEMLICLTRTGEF